MDQRTISSMTKNEKYLKFPFDSPAYVQQYLNILLRTYIIMGVTGGGGANAPPIFFYLSIIFLPLSWKAENKQK